jgi:hypothetical protein
VRATIATETHVEGDAMPKVKSTRKKKSKPPIAGPVMAPAIEVLLRDVDERLERVAAEGKRSAPSQEDRWFPQVALLAARWLATRRLLELELAANNTRISPGDTPTRVEDAWAKAVIEASAPTEVFFSGPNRQTDPLAPIAQEIATYRARLPDLVREHEGEFVLIKGSNIIGFFPDETSALREGRRRLGIVHMLVKQVSAKERVTWL